MQKEPNQAKDAVEANMEINEQLADGKVQASTKGRSEAESANLEMQDRFRGKNNQSAEGVSPAFIYNPAMDLNPENED